VTGAAVRVREGEQGAEVVITSILVGIAVKVGASAAEALWIKVIWPALRRRLGTGVLGGRLARAAGTDTGASTGGADAGG